METGERVMKSNARKWADWDIQMLVSLFLLAVVGIFGCSGNEATKTAGVPAQSTFTTPAEASQALQKAARAGDENTLAQILGPKSKSILSSGDPVEDKAALQSFVGKFDQMNRWVAMTDDSQILNIGADNYPFPIPLVRNASSQWYFNTAAGEDEILARQIGRNELLAMDACTSIANAEELYFQQAHDGKPAHQYTSMIISSPGKQDGLYWDVPEGQLSSPLGKLNDFVSKNGMSSLASSGPQVFDGYSFRILTAQGDKAKGGKKSYVVNGKMAGGFAVIASPVKYRDSGIKTFILSREGVVCEKDLGPNTVDAATAINDYNPADEWTPVE